MECQPRVIPVCCRVLIKVTSAPLCSHKSIRALNGSWQRQAQHIINDNSPSQRREHIWQLLLIAVIFMRCQAVMFKVGFICRDCLAQMLILQGWLVSTSSPSHTFLLKLSQTSADRGRGITVVSFYCCCLSKGAYIESNFPLKGANCLQKIVTAIAWRWLDVSFGCWQQRIEEFHMQERKGSKKKERKKRAVHIKGCVVKNECEFSHAPDDGNGCCFARWWGKKNNRRCVFVCSYKEVEVKVWWGFIRNYILKMEKWLFL